MFTKKVIQLTLVKDESLLHNKVIIENNSNNSRKKQLISIKKLTKSNSEDKLMSCLLRKIKFVH